MSLLLTQALVATGFNFSYSGNATNITYKLTSNNLGDFLKYNGHDLLKFNGSEQHVINTILKYYKNSDRKFNRFGRDLIKLYGDRPSKNDIEGLKTECLYATNSTVFNLETYWLSLCKANYNCWIISKNTHK